MKTKIQYKREDVVLQNFRRLIKEFYDRYRNWIIGITTAVGIVVALAIIFLIRMKQTREYVENQIVISESHLYQKNYSEAYKILDNIITHYRRTKYAGYAMYLKAKSLYENKDFESTIKLCLEILKIKKPKSVIVPTMYLLGLSYTAINNYDEAIKIFNQIIQNYPNHFYCARVYESLAICYELKGDTQSAKSVYEKMNLLYPGTYWSELAQQKISKL